MRHHMFWAAMVGVLLAVAGSASAQMCMDYLYSTDLGSDWDLSDPTGNGIVGFMDCGAIYRVTAGVPAPVPVLWKDDDSSVAGSWMGRPFPSAAAPQPIPGQFTPPGPSFAGFIPQSTAAEAYAAYFDLDGEDQVVRADMIFEGFQTTEEEFALAGIYKPGASNVRMSFENDFAPGWFDATHISDVPTLVKFDTNWETYAGGISCTSPLPNVATAECDEFMIGLGRLQPSDGQDHDDDVDALDWHEETAEFMHRYFTADHEAHLGLDPGDIYHTVNDGTVNIMHAIDDVTQIGVQDSTDVDAWEFVNIDVNCAESLFGPDFVSSLDPSLNVLAAIFSVDEDDPDTPLDESGGLNPSVIYMTNLVGAFAPVSGDYSMALGDPFDRRQDIDALTVVPEPATMALLAVGGLGILLKRKR